MLMDDILQAVSKTINEGDDSADELKRMMISLTMEYITLRLLARVMLNGCQDLCDDPAPNSFIAASVKVEAIAHLQRFFKRTDACFKVTS